MKSIPYLIFLSLGLSLWFLACDKGEALTDKSTQPANGIQPPNSIQPTNGTHPDTGSQANNGSQKYLDCYAVIDTTQCSTAVDMQGQPLNCALHSVDTTKCVPLAFVNTTLGGCAEFNGPNFAKCTDAHTDENNDPLVCQASIWYPATCVPDGMENAVKTCVDIKLANTSVVNPEQYCKASNTLGMKDDGTRIDLDCAKNTNVGKCLEASLKDVVESCHSRSVASGSDAGQACSDIRQKFARNEAGEVDLTKTETVACAVNNTDRSRCVVSEFRNHKILCKDFAKADCKAGAKTLNVNGDGEIERDCALNKYTNICLLSTKADDRPATCALVTNMDKCEGLKLPDDSAVQAVCRKNPKNNKICQDAPKKMLCKFNSTQIDILKAFFVAQCNSLAKDNCKGYCKMAKFNGKDICAPLDWSANKSKLDSLCKGDTEMVWDTDTKSLVPGLPNCEINITVGTKTSSSFCTIID